MCYRSYTNLNTQVRFLYSLFHILYVQRERELWDVTLYKGRQWPWEPKETPPVTRMYNILEYNHNPLQT